LLHFAREKNVPLLAAEVFDCGECPDRRSVLKECEAGYGHEKRE